MSVQALIDYRLETGCVPPGTPKGEAVAASARWALAAVRDWRELCPDFWGADDERIAAAILEVKKRRGEELRRCHGGKSDET